MTREHARVRARPIYPGRRVKITRRCVERKLLLTPDDAGEVEQLVGFTLGLALRNNGQQLHAACAMSNHMHEDVTDVLGTLPSFKNSLHANIARSMNAKRGRFDKFWSAEGSCDTAQPTDEESLDDLVYTLTNPVDAGLVKWGHRWPGFTTYGWRFGETRVYKRPSWFFDPSNGEIPDSVSITLVRPDIFRHLTDDELYDLLMQRVRQRELEIHRKMRKLRRRFVGEHKLCKQRWERTSMSYEERFTVTPKVASSSKWLRLAQLQRDREWEAEYAASRAVLLAGGKPEYPPGTYWMRIHAGVAVRAGTSPP